MNAFEVVWITMLLSICWGVFGFVYGHTKGKAARKTHKGRYLQREEMDLADALKLADEWGGNLAPYEDAEDWRVACRVLADEVKTLRERVTELKGVARGDMFQHY